MIDTKEKYFYIFILAVNIFSIVNVTLLVTATGLALDNIYLLLGSLIAATSLSWFFLYSRHLVSQGENISVSKGLTSLILIIITVGGAIAFSIMLIFVLIPILTIFQLYVSGKIIYTLIKFT